MCKESEELSVADKAIKERGLAGPRASGTACRRLREEIVTPLRWDQPATVCAECWLSKKTLLSRNNTRAFKRVARCIAIFICAKVCPYILLHLFIAERQRSEPFSIKWVLPRSSSSSDAGSCTFFARLSQPHTPVVALVSARYIIVAYWLTSLLPIKQTAALSFRQQGPAFPVSVNTQRVIYPAVGYSKRGKYPLRLCFYYYYNSK